jgi:predicted kinase
MTTWVLLAGLPATGKSTLARALENRLHAVTLSKDRVREALFPGAATDFTQEQDDLCMHAIRDAAAYLTARKIVDFILLDGRSFSRRQQIEEVLRAAERAGARWRILHLTCTDAVAETRLGHKDPGHPARNRDWTLYRQIKQRFEPISHPKLDVDTSLGVDSQLEKVRAYLEDIDGE